MSNSDVLTEAKARFHRCHDWESVTRTRQRFDVKFGMADATNGDQWPQQTLLDRQRSNKPCLTINKTRQHCLNIINDARANHPGITVKPIANGATYRAAEVFQGIIRHIEYASDAQAAYDAATWWQVFSGCGYWRVLTEYMSDSSFDLQIKIGRIDDPNSVYLDPDITFYSGEDARYGFVFKDIAKDLFDQQYPKYADKIGSLSALGEDDIAGWYSKDHIRVCEYFRKVEEKDTLHYLENGSVVRRSQFKAQGPGLLDQLDAVTLRTREISVPHIEWYLIGGGESIMDKSEWPGKYIPIVRVIGEETCIDGVLDRRGHVRAMIDPQRIYNYWSSSTVEQVALQTRIPFTGPAKAIENLETYYEQANLVNSAFLPYNQFDDQGRELRSPERINPPTMAQAYIEGLKISSQEMQDVSGQFESTFGEPSNERSGKAIDARTRNAATSTFHYVDHLGQAIKYTGKILIDLIPKIYDAERVLRIMGDDGTSYNVKIDPNLGQAHQELSPSDPYDDFTVNDVALVFDPNVGDYTVQSDTGQSFATRREQLMNALNQILTQNENAFPLVADLYFRNMDIPGADELADRMYRMVPPQALGKTDPQVEQLQQQLAAQHQIMQQMAQKLQVQDGKQQDAQLRAEVDVYRSETERLAAVGKIDPQALKPIVRELVSQILGVPVNAVIAAHMQEDAQALAATLQHPAQESAQQHQQTMQQQQAAHQQAMQQQDQQQQGAMQQAAMQQQTSDGDTSG